MTTRQLVAMPNVSASFTGHSAYLIGSRRVWLLDHTGRTISYVLRSDLPSDFGPDMQTGAFGMADAYNKAAERGR